jgi:hypothetical protein
MTRKFGRKAASAMASASLQSFFWPFTNGLTQMAGMLRGACPSTRSVRLTKMRA